MDTALVEKLAQEYVRLVDEGWSPDLDEFVGRVPKELREPCRLRIEGLTEAANEAAQPDLDDEPEAEAAGPQRLTKQEALAMWDSQLGRS